MDRRSMLQSLGALPLLGATLAEAHGAGMASPETVIYELRIYHAHEGRLHDVLKRFREHTVALFDKHGMKSIAYWTALDEPLKGKTLFYILAHPSREAATANWAAFLNDPEWKKVRDASEVAGPIVDSADTHFMAMTDFRPGSDKAELPLSHDLQRRRQQRQYQDQQSDDAQQ